MKELDIQRFASVYETGHISGQKLEEIDKALLKFAELQKVIEALQFLINDITQKAATIQSKIDGFEDTIAEMEQKINNQNADLKETQDQVETINTEVQELKNNFDAAKTDLEELTVKLQSAKALAENSVINVEHTSQGTDFYSQNGKVGSIPLANYNE